LGGLIYLRLGLADVRGDARASRLESSLMQMAVHASVRRQAPNTTNPVAPSEDNLIAGGKIYLNECSGCHGTPGKPNEPDSLNPAAPRLAEDGIFGGTDFLGGEARDPAQWHVLEWRLGFRPETVDGGGLHLPGQESSSKSRARNRDCCCETGKLTTLSDGCSKGLGIRATFSYLLLGVAFCAAVWRDSSLLRNFSFDFIADVVQRAIVS
jgi:hypothetical protein